MPKKLLIVFSAVVVTVLGLLLYIAGLFQPAAPSNPTPQTFLVPKGQAVSVIAQRLYEEKLVRSPLVFRLVVKLQKLEDKVQAGSFKVSPSMSVDEIAQELTKGTNDVWVTIPEGWRREEIAQSLSRQEDFIAFNKEEFLSLTAGDEGTLFPDTYLIAKESTAETIYRILTNTFDKKVIAGLKDEIENSEREFDDVLIMASIVEREARGEQDMKHVAGILWKRLELGMPLQADAALQYAKGYNDQTQGWWDPPQGADRQLNSPFNTYLNPGLPPHPISNPGLLAIKAALQPLETDDLFYLHDRQGEIHYAQSLEEHNANINRYLR